MPLPWLVHRHDSFILCCYGLFGVVGTKSEKLYKEYCDPLFFETLKDVKSAKSKRGFGVFLLLCQYVFCLFSLNGDLWYALIIGNLVWSSWPKKPAVLRVLRQSTLSLYRKLSVCECVCVCVCVSLPACGWGFECVGICARERDRREALWSLLSVLQVLTVYICVNILSPVHLRATVNKQEPVLLIKALTVMASSFTVHLFIVDVWALKEWSRELLRSSHPEKHEMSLVPEVISFELNESEKGFSYSVIIGL